MKMTKEELKKAGSKDSQNDLRIYRRLLSPWTEKKLNRSATRLTGRKDVHVSMKEEGETSAGPKNNKIYIKICLPAFFRVNEDFETNLLRLEGALAHECGHVNFSDFALMGQIRCDEAAANNEVPVYAEKLDPTDAEKIEILHTLIKEMVKKRVEGHLFNSLEDAAIESLMYDAHPETYGALIAVRDAISEQEIKAEQKYANTLKQKKWDTNDRYLLDRLVCEIRTMSVLGYRKPIPTPLLDHFYSKKDREEMFWDSRIARLQAKTTKARLMMTEIFMEKLDPFIERKAQRLTRGYIDSVLTQKAGGMPPFNELNQILDAELTVNVEVDPGLASLCPPPHVNSEFELDAPKDIQEKINNKLKEEKDKEERSSKDSGSGSKQSEEGTENDPSSGDSEKNDSQSETKQDQGSDSKEDSSNTTNQSSSGQSADDRETDEMNNGSSASEENKDQNGNSRSRSEHGDSENDGQPENAEAGNSESAEEEGSEKESEDLSEETGSSKCEPGDQGSDSGSKLENEPQENQDLEENATEREASDGMGDEEDPWKDYYDSKEMREEIESQAKRAALASRESLNKIKNQIKVEEAKEFTQAVSKKSSSNGGKREALQSIADISPISDLHENVSISIVRSDKLKHAVDSEEGKAAKRDQNNLKKSAIKWARPMKQLLMYQGNTSIRKGLSNGDLNRTGLYRAKTDLKIFKKKTVGKEKKARFCTLIDCSGSMNWNKMINAIKAAYMLGEACKSIQVPISIYGHTTDNSGVKLYECVSYEDNKDKTCFDSLFKLSSEWGNRDGLAMFQCLTEMVRSSKQDEILIFLVISDGWPVYGNASNEEAALDMQVIMEKFEKTYNVKSIGVGIGEECDCVREIYKNALIVENVEGLGNELLKILKNEILN